MSSVSLLEASSREPLYPLDKWFPTDGSERVKNIAIGAITALGAFLALTALFYVLETHCTWFSVSQDALEIFNIFKNVHPLLDVLWKGVWRIYVVIAGPIIEEVCFRGWVNDQVEKCMGEEQTVWKKVMRVALVAILFGACHLSPFQNTVSNLVILGAASALGLVFGILKETRQDLAASTAAHIIFNLASTI